MDGKVYVTTYTSSCFMYDIDKNCWDSLPILSRFYCSLVALHSRKQLLAIGGSLKSGGMSNEILLLDENCKKWDIKYPNMPTPRCSITGICYHSTVIVAGGITNWTPWTLTKVVEVLHINDSSPSDSQWSTVEQLPHLMYGAIPLLCNDNLYISSVLDYVDLQQDENTLTVVAVSVPKLLKSNHTNTVSSSLWHKLPDPPYSSCSIVCFRDHLITFTGIHMVEKPYKSKPIIKLNPEIHIYNSCTLSWDCVGSVSIGYVLGRSVCIDNNKIIFVGGLTGTHNPYDSETWVSTNLQLELTEFVHK